MSPILTFLIFGFVIILTAVIFVGWIVFHVVRAIGDGVARLVGLVRPRRMVQAGPIAMPGRGVTCTRRGCGALNPLEARFCRRCGQTMPAAQRVMVRRAAGW